MYQADSNFQYTPRLSYPLRQTGSDLRTVEQIAGIVSISALEKGGYMEYERSNTAQNQWMNRYPLSSIGIGEQSSMPSLDSGIPDIGGYSPIIGVDPAPIPSFDKGQSGATFPSGYTSSKTKAGKKPKRKRSKNSEGVRSWERDPWGIKSAWNAPNTPEDPTDPWGIMAGRDTPSGPNIGDGGLGIPGDGANATQGICPCPNCQDAIRPNATLSDPIPWQPPVFPDTPTLSSDDPSLYNGVNRLENSNSENQLNDGIHTAGSLFWSGGAGYTSVSNLGTGKNQLIAGGQAAVLSDQVATHQQTTTFVRSAGQPYTLSAWIQTDSIARLTVTWNDLAATVNEFDYTDTNSSVMKVSEQLEPPAGATQATIKWQNTAAGTSYIAENMLSDGEALPPYTHRMFATPAQLGALNDSLGYSDDVIRPTSTTYAGEPANVYTPDSAYPLRLHSDDPTIYYPDGAASGWRTTVDPVTGGWTAAHYDSVGAAWDDHFTISENGDVDAVTLAAHEITAYGDGTTSTNFGATAGEGWVDVDSPFVLKDSGTPYLRFYYESALNKSFIAPYDSSSTLHILAQNNFLYLDSLITIQTGDNTVALTHQLAQAGTGNAIYQMRTSSTYWSMGIDNSDNGKLLFSNSSVLTTNTWLSITAGLIAGTLKLDTLALEHATPATSNTVFRITNSTTATYDPVLELTGEGSTWSLYLDDNDSDKFKIVNSSVTDMKFAIDPIGKLGIGTDSPATMLNLHGATAGFMISNGATAIDTTPNAGASTDGYSLQYNRDTGEIAHIGFSTVGATYQTFYTQTGGVASSEKMRITSNGNVGIGVSSLTSGGGILEISNGITFPATQSASTNANTLDDYKEGTWTATLSGGIVVTGTPNHSYKYIKIGKMVFVSVKLAATTSISVANWSTISLPFTQDSTTFSTGMMVNASSHANISVDVRNSVINADAAITAGANEGLLIGLTYYANV